MSLDVIGSVEGGFGVISTREISGCSERLAQENPPRIFAGVDTFYYVFNDEPECKNLMHFDGESYNPEYLQSDDEIKRALVMAVQKHLDDKAKERNYDGILSLCTYATSTNAKFSAEGQAGVEWRDACWAKCYAVMAECETGVRHAPTVMGLIAELPTFVWPEIQYEK